MALRFKLTPRELPPGIHLGEVRVATLQDGRWQPLPTRFPSPGVVEGLTTHFSTFAIIAPCHVSGDGTDFPLSDCPTFNPRIQTSAPVALEAKGASITLAMTLRPTLAGGPVDFTISGLTPGWTYFLSRDASSHLDSLPASGTGALTFTQDTSAAHHLLLMIRHGSVSLTAASCPQIGTWDAGTCTLTADILSPPVYIEEDDVQLDCAGHTIGGADTASVGIDFYKRRRVGVHHCVISNADYGIIAGGAGIRLSDLSVSTPVGATPGKMGFDLTSSSDLTLSDAQVNGFKSGFGVSGGSIIGFAADNGTNITISRVTLKVAEVPAFVTGTYDLTLDDLLLDGALSGTGPADPLADTNPGAIQLVNATRTRILKLRTTGPMTAFGGIVTTVESGVTVEGANLSAANVGLRLDDYGPDENLVTGSSFLNTVRAVVLNGGRRTHIFRNNFFGSGSPMVMSSGAMELSDTDAGSPTFQQGNYWGRACPGPLFVAGADTTRADAIDSFPFGAASAWDAGAPTGCHALVPVPTLSSPVDGDIIGTSTPAFVGHSTPGVTIELLEAGIVKATTIAGPTGDFQLRVPAPLVDGVHSVTVRARLNGGMSSNSSAVSFIVDTIAPAPPVILTPQAAATVFESDVTVLGSAEPNSRVVVSEGAAILGSSSALAGMFSLVVPGVSAGAHTISARATDAAGNVSLPSTPVSFTVRAPSVASPMLGVGRKVAITSARSASNPFSPSLGQVNPPLPISVRIKTTPKLL